MGLTVNREMALKLTVNRQKQNIFTVNRQMSEPKLAVKLLKAVGRGSAFCKTLQTQQQLDLELPQSLAGESDSELNSECTIHSRLTLN